jgi:hypothetical protein
MKNAVFPSHAPHPWLWLALLLLLSGRRMAAQSHCQDIHAGDTITAFCQNADGSGDITFVGRFGSAHFSQSPALMSRRLRDKRSAILDLFNVYSLNTLIKHQGDDAIPVYLREELDNMVPELPKVAKKT